MANAVRDHDCTPLPGRPLPGPANPPGVCDLCGKDVGVPSGAPPDVTQCVALLGSMVGPLLRIADPSLNDGDLSRITDEARSLLEDIARVLRVADLDVIPLGNDWLRQGETTVIRTAVLDAILAQRDGLVKYEVIWEWLSENYPRALELCPYKVRDA